MNIDDIIKACNSSRTTKRNGQQAKRKFLRVPMQHRFAYAPNGKIKPPTKPPA